MYLQRWHGWCHKNLLPESQSRCVLCTPYNHAPCHFMQSHICKVYVCLAVTCHLRFWQNDGGLSHATAVTQGWNGYQNKSQHRKLTPEKKILPPLLRGFEPATFRSWVLCSNHWAIPAPILYGSFLMSSTQQKLRPYPVWIISDDFYTAETMSHILRHSFFRHQWAGKEGWTHITILPLHLLFQKN